MCGEMIDVLPKLRKRKLFNSSPYLLMKFAHTSAELQFPRTEKGRDIPPICDWFIIVHVIIFVNPKQEVPQSEKSQHERLSKMC